MEIGHVTTMFVFPEAGNPNQIIWLFLKIFSFKRKNNPSLVKYNHLWLQKHNMGMIKWQSWGFNVLICNLRGDATVAIRTLGTGNKANVVFGSSAF